MRRFDIDDSDLVIVGGGVVTITALILLRENAKDIVMAYLTGSFGIVGLKKRRKEGLPYGE